MAIWTHTRGRVTVACDICGWQTKAPDMSGAHLALAHHNHQNHPGVFPRWNPNAHAIESKGKGV